MTAKAIGYLALTVALMAGAAGYFYGLGKDQAKAAEQQNIELKAKVDALSKDSATHKALADTKEQEVKDRDAKIAKLKAKRAAYRAASLSPAGQTDCGNAHAVEDPNAAGAIQDQIIAAQDEQIAALKVEVTELRTALDLKDQALIASEKRARGLEIALEAQRHTSKSQRWLGRIEGVLVGLGAGYAVGRVF